MASVLPYSPQTSPYKKSVAKPTQKKCPKPTAALYSSSPYKSTHTQKFQKENAALLSDLSDLGDIESSSDESEEDENRCNSDHVQREIVSPSGRYKTERQLLAPAKRKKDIETKKVKAEEIDELFEDDESYMEELQRILEQQDDASDYERKRKNTKKNKIAKTSLGTPKSQSKATATAPNGGVTTKKPAACRVPLQPVENISNAKPPRSRSISNKNVKKSAREYPSSDVFLNTPLSDLFVENMPASPKFDIVSKDFVLSPILPAKRLSLKDKSVAAVNDFANQETIENDIGESSVPESASDVLYPTSCSNTVNSCETNLDNAVPKSLKVDILSSANIDAKQIENDAAVSKESLLSLPFDEVLQNYEIISLDEEQKRDILRNSAWQSDLMSGSAKVEPTRSPFDKGSTRAKLYDAQEQSRIQLRTAWRDEEVRLVLRWEGDVQRAVERHVRCFAQKTKVLKYQQRLERETRASVACIKAKWAQAMDEIQERYDIVAGILHDSQQAEWLRAFPHDEFCESTESKEFTKCIPKVIRWN